MKNTSEENLIREVIEVISGEQNEIQEEKKIVYDKTTQQFSLKIPKSIALKAGIKEGSILNIVFNPVASREKIEKAKFVIYLKEVQDSEGKKTA